MKIKRIVPAVLAVFVFIFLFEWVFHGVWLKEMYEATPQLWRPQSVMPQYFPFLTLGQILFSIFLGVLFAFRYKGEGAKEGITFGMLVGLLVAPVNLISYAIQPLAFTLILFWIVGGLVEMTVAGLLLGLICKPKAL